MIYNRLEKLRVASGWREWQVAVGGYALGTGQILRLVGVAYGGQGYSYLTNVLDSSRLKGLEIAWLYRQRWQIE